jgi:hypothetical protein
VSDLIANMNATGYAAIPNYVRPEVLQRMQDFVASAVEKSGRQYVGFNGKDDLAGSQLDLCAEDPAFQDLFRRLFAGATGKPPPPVTFYLVLRCLVGETSQKHAFYFHYDSYVITGLIPIVMPERAPYGDFIMFPNTRSIRRFYASNIVDKLLLENPISQYVLRKVSKARWIRSTRVRLTPGTLYFFWGYRSIHTNEDHGLDEVRATALFHYANPHAR